MRRSRKNQTRAFTLIELIIVIAVIAILIALLLPAIQAARAAALKNSGRNNMKQLLLAMHNHADTYKTFPPLYFSAMEGQKGQMNVVDATGQYTWVVRILPFIEEDMMYKSISTASNRFTTDATKVQLATPAGQVSPGTIELTALLAPNNPGSPAGTTNYVALSSTRQPLLTSWAGAIGSQTNKTPPDGMIVPDKLGRGTSMARMADGTSKTTILCESREQTKANWYTPQQVFVCGFLPEDTKPVDEDKTKYYPYFGAEGWVGVPGNDRTALNYGPAKPGKPVPANPLANPAGVKQAYNGDPKDPLARDWGPSSMNMGGIVLHGMGDGSVQEVSDTGVDPQVYFSAITARGGENQPGLGGF